MPSQTLEGSDQLAAESILTPDPQPAQRDGATKGHGRLIPELDGVRGLAILMVMLNHSVEIQLVPDGVLKQLGVFRLVEIGWSGVDLFFVLSGFLITGILLDSRSSKNYFSSFYARRALRIFPLYLITVFVYFRLIWHFGKDHAVLLSSAQVLEKWLWFHLSNWTMAFGTPTGAVGHFWSLAVEEQFYLVWPLVLFLVPRRWLIHVCLGVIAVSFGLRVAYAHNPYGRLFLYELTPFRIDSLAIGGLAAMLVRNNRAVEFLRANWRLSWVALCGAFLVALAALGQRNLSNIQSPMNLFGYSGLAIMAASLVLYAYLNSAAPGWLSVLLRMPFLRAFGKYSYAIYILHVFVFVVWGMVYRSLVSEAPKEFIPVFWVLGVGAGMAMSFGVGILSWNLLEKHFLNLKKRFAVNY